MTVSPGVYARAFPSDSASSTCRAVLGPRRQRKDSTWSSNADGFADCDLDMVDFVLSTRDIVSTIDIVMASAKFPSGAPARRGNRGGSGKLDPARLERGTWR